MSTQAPFAQQLAFVAAQRHPAEDAILAQALREGVQALYHEALVEAYLLHRIPREQILQELGSDQLEELEYQRDALARDVAWGRQHA
jgi:hypothetical protein